VGSNGFGFDPVMWLPEFGQTFAQLPTEVKNANSHRGRAAQAMVALMRERWLGDAAQLMAHHSIVPAGRKAGRPRHEH
jgi:XTP/dITP diphosphohydrolase